MKDSLQHIRERLIDSLISRDSAECEMLCKHLSNDALWLAWRKASSKYYSLHDKHGHDRHRVTKEARNQWQLYCDELLRRGYPPQTYGVCGR